MEFTEDHAMFRKTVRDFVEREINPQDHERLIRDSIAGLSGPRR